MAHGFVEPKYGMKEYEKDYETYKPYQFKANEMTDKALEAQTRMNRHQELGKKHYRTHTREIERDYARHKGKE